jgi:FAD/FMN-containing dehydrogenase
VDEHRARIHDDLRGIIAGELLFEPLERAPYAVDASLFEVDPTGVIVPRTHDDVVAAVRYAVENGLKLHPRGAGTGTVGGAIGPGLVIDFSRYFHRVVEVLPEHVVVESGVVLDVLNAQLAPLGRRIGPDPDGSDVATIGGLVARDAAGPSSLRYGTIGDHVERLRVVFADGETAEIGRERWPCASSGRWSGATSTSWCGAPGGLRVTPPASPWRGPPRGWTSTCRG